VTDPSLFPERWPDRERVQRASPSCCDQLTPPPPVTPRVWQTLHTLAHSRTAFTVDYVADLCHVDAGNVELGVARAVEQGWIESVWQEPYMVRPPGLYTGRLRKR
jgi:hypothetical protein